MNTIKKFNHLCDILINQHGYNRSQILMEAKISWPTMKKIREKNVKDDNFRASLLDVLNAYIEKHIDKLITCKGSRSVKNKVDSVPHSGSGSESGNENSDNIFWDLIQKAIAVKPQNIILQISAK